MTARCAPHNPSVSPRLGRPSKNRRRSSLGGSGGEHQIDPGTPSGPATMSRRGVLVRLRRSSLGDAIVCGLTKIEARPVAFGDRALPDEGHVTARWCSAPYWSAPSRPPSSRPFAPIARLPLRLGDWSGQCLHFGRTSTFHRARKSGPQHQCATKTRILSMMGRPEWSPVARLPSAGPNKNTLRSDHSAMTRPARSRTELLVRKKSAHRELVLQTG